MGIRYYAYAFDRQLTDFAKEHPFYLIGYDPLGDAWGTDDYYDEVSHPFLHRADKSEGFLYLDKAWSELQALTREGQGVEGAGSWGFPGMRRPLRVGPNDGWTVPIEDDREPPAQCLPEGPTVDPEWDGRTTVDSTHIGPTVDSGPDGGEVPGDGTETVPGAGPAGADADPGEPAEEGPRPWREPQVAWGGRSGGTPGQSRWADDDYDYDGDYARFSPSFSCAWPDGSGYVDDDVMGMAGARPSYRMFRGEVQDGDRGWNAWVSIVTPDEMPEIATDLTQLAEELDSAAGESRGRAQDPQADDPMDYVRSYAHRAKDFAVRAAAKQRGVIYFIG